MSDDKFTEKDLWKDKKDSPKLDYDKIKNMYEKQLLSWQQIADKFDTYPNKIIRFVKANGGVETRTMSDAQKLSLKKGRRKHPTKGTQRPESVKNAIGDKQAENWENISDEERERRSKLAKEAWNNKTAEEIEDFQQRAIQGVLKASKDGSKFENMVYQNLIDDGYTVERQKEDIIGGENVHVDIFLPELSTAIEIDGPAHFLPIWGEAKLAKHKAKDNKKNGLLLHKGYTVLRVKCITKTVTKVKMRKAYSEILLELQNIENNPTQKHNNLIEITVE